LDGRILFTFILQCESLYAHNQMITIAKSITYLYFFIFHWNTVFQLLLKDYSFFLYAWTRHTWVMMTRTIWQYEKLKFKLKNKNFLSLKNEKVLKGKLSITEYIGVYNFTLNWIWTSLATFNLLCKKHNY
jgi:hypothetical protein